MIQSFPPVTSGRVSMLPNTEEFPNISEQPSETTEYKSQFAWPRKTTESTPCMARKSVSMSIIKGSDETGNSCYSVSFQYSHFSYFELLLSLILLFCMYWIFSFLYNIIKILKHKNENTSYLYIWIF